MYGKCTHYGADVGRRRENQNNSEEESIMNYRDEYEQVVDLKDLLFHILYRWRSVLVVAILVCALMAGYAVLSNERNSAERIPTVQTEVAEGEEPPEEPKTMSPVKYAVIGFVAGIFVMVFLYGMAYVLSDRLRGERELGERYGYLLLGAFPRSGKRRLLGVIDRMLVRAEGVSEGIETDEVYRIVATNIVNLAGDCRNVLVTGTVDADRLEEFTEVVASQVEGVELVMGTNMNMTASTLEALAACDAVILVEEKNRSLRAKIQKEQESIAALNKPVVGYVLL